MEPLVTIAIPDLAGLAARQASLDSVTRHTPEPYEVVLFVEAPVESDASKRTDYPLLQIEASAPLSIPHALNTLLERTTTPFLLLLESGAIVTSGWLERLLKALDDPLVGLSGPSTNSSWNEQRVLSGQDGGAWSVAQIDHYAATLAARYRNQTRSLDTLHSLGDFCYLFKRSVAVNLGGFDEAYGAGPCWEIDFTTRAARAGFRAIWVLDAYVHRMTTSPWKATSIRRYFTASKQLYQDRFCGLRLQGKKTGYEPHCRGEACPHFAPSDLIRVKLPSRAGDRLLEMRSDHSGNNEDASTDMPATNPLIGANSQADKSVVHLPKDMKQSEQPDSLLIRITPTSNPPLVSCIMPTRNRRVFARQSIAYFERQDYPNRELIIVDDGDDRIADLIPADNPQFRYIALPRQTSIGAKRNIAMEQAQGAIIAHWDDDDWYAHHRLQHQIGPLLDKKADMTGLETSCFFDLSRWQAWTCSPDLHRRLFAGDVHGGTLVYWRWVWQELAQYPSLSLAEDARFLQQACRRGACLQKLPHANSFAYIRHESNAWKFPLGVYLQPSGWQHADPQRFIPPADLAFYDDHSPAGPTPKALASDEKNEPGLLVSCIMPTYNRRTYVPQAISYFLRQDYPHRELIILDDGDQPVQDLIPPDPRIRYLRLEKRLILGAKRNVCCSEAKGAIIVHWDDDDWMASHRLRYQVEALEQAGADLCGTTRQLYYKPATDQAWLYEYPPQARRWLAGNTLCYRKTLWERNPFPEVAIGEDARFVWSSQVKNAVLLSDHRFYVGMVHAANTSPKSVAGLYWKPHPVEEVHHLLSDDLSFYLPSGLLRCV